MVSSLLTDQKSPSTVASTSWLPFIESVLDTDFRLFSSGGRHWPFGGSVSYQAAKQSATEKTLWCEVVYVKLTKRRSGGQLTKTLVISEMNNRVTICGCSE